MKASVCSWILSLAVLCGYQAVRADSPIEEVNKLRRQAVVSRTKSEADQKLDQAEDLLKKLQRSMSSLDYAFAQNQITQTRGLVCIAFWQRNRSDVHLRDQGQQWLLTALDKYDWLAKECEDAAEAIVAARG